MITHVAIRFEGKVWSLPAPNRHHDVIRLIRDETGVDSVDVRDDDEGFLDEADRYYRRKPALYHARRCGQVKNQGLVRAGMLTSEDVW